MRTPLIDRRKFLHAAGATFIVGLSKPAFAAALKTDAVFATACQSRSGAYGVAILSEAGAVLERRSAPFGRGPVGLR